MISKECFSKILDASRNYYDRLNEISDFIGLQAESPLWYILDSILDALSNEVESLDDGRDSWLEPIIFDYAFCYNWGRSYKENDFIVKIDDEKYKPLTSEDLYDCLLKVYNLT